jgi:hypothetical protein
MAHGKKQILVPSTLRRGCARVCTMALHHTAIKMLYWLGLAALLLAGWFGAAVNQRRHAFDRLLVAAGAAHDLDPRLLAAIACAGGPDDGSIGLFRLTADDGRAWAKATGRPVFDEFELYDPELNAAAGAWRLSRCFREGGVTVDVSQAVSRYFDHLPGPARSNRVEAVLHRYRTPTGPGA